MAAQRACGINQSDAGARYGVVRIFRGGGEWVGVISASSGSGGAGATIPLPGFGHALVQGILKAISQEGALGLLTGGFTATAAGISVAILASWVAALLFDPKS